MRIKVGTLLFAGFTFIATFLSAAQEDTVYYDNSNDAIIQELSKFKHDNSNNSFNEIGNKVLNQLNERMKNHTDSAWLYIQRGWLYISMGQIDNAIADFNKSIKINPTASAYMGLGMAYNNKGQTKLANEAYLTALRTKTSYPTDIPPLSDAQPISTESN